MSIENQSTLVPSTFGASYILDCANCGQQDFGDHEHARYKRMVEYHRKHCPGRVRTRNRPAPAGSL